MGAFQYSRDSDSPKAGKVEITGRIVMSTELGIMLDDGVTKQWLPRRKVTIVEIGKGFVEVLMPEWLARDKRYV